MTSKDLAWHGWSTDQEVVDTNRVLSGLFASLPPGGDQTTGSIEDVATELGIWAGQLHRRADHIALNLELFEPSFITPPVESCAMHLNPLGHLVAAEFKQQLREPRFLRTAARRALVLWRDSWQAPKRSGVTFSTSGGLSAAWPRLADFLAAPHSWFYGRQFTPTEVGDAAEYLSDRGHVELVDPKSTLTAAPAGRDRRLRQAVRLTATGTICAEQFDGNVEQLEATQQAATNTLNNYGTIGNAAAGPVGSQTSTAVDNRSAGNLIALVQAVEQLGWIPPALADEMAAVIAELHAAATGGADLSSGVQHARQLLLTAVSDAAIVPAAAALLSAIATLPTLSVETVSLR